MEDGPAVLRDGAALGDGVDLGDGAALEDGAGKHEHAEPIESSLLRQRSYDHNKIWLSWHSTCNIIRCYAIS